jgi:uncharacterized protein
MEQVISNMRRDKAVQNRLINQLGLIPHPEGGFFRETYRCDETILRSGSGLQRSASTAIYYLLCDGAYSVWHRIRSDEVWHFYAGNPLEVHVLEPGGRRITHRLGNALEDSDAVFQAVVRAGCWFAAECVDAQGYALAGCTVAPGFEFSDFELAETDALLADYPGEAALIERLGPTPPPSA